MDLTQILFPHMFINNVSDDLIDDEDEYTNNILDEYDMMNEKTGAMPKR